MKMIAYIFSYLSIVCYFFSLEAYPYYFIAIKKNEGNVLDSLDSYIPFLPKQNQFIADPMLFKYKGQNYIFYEEYDYKKGNISFVTITSEGVLSEPKVALETPGHLSFPYVFADEDEIYMIPETYEEREIVLYKAINFPDKWEKQRVLVRGKVFADSMIFKYGGYYWLFTAEYCETLRIYYSKSLKGRFRPHPINKENRIGRNAGGVFYRDNLLIRPVMDCTDQYGRAVILKEIMELTPTIFKERSIFYMEPVWHPQIDGTHTYNENEDFVVYDGKIEVSE